MTIMPVAVPAITSYFSLGQDLVHWVSTGFMAAMAFSMLLTPWLVARFGFRRVYEVSLLLLLGGAVCSSLAPNFGSLVLARLVEGVAAGILQPLPVIVVSMAFGDGQRGRAMGIFTLGTVLAPALSPVLGGLLIQMFGWRAVPLALTPMCLLALPAGRWLRCYGAKEKADEWSIKTLDLISIGLAAGAIFCVLVGLSIWRSANAWACFALVVLGLLAGAMFLRRQGQLVKPILSIKVFGSRNFALTCLVAFIYGLGVFGSAYLIPIFIQQVLLRTAAEAGAVMLPAGLLLVVSSPVGGWLSDRFQTSRVIAAGMCLLAVAFTALVAVQVHTELSFIIMILMFSRLGMALVLPSLTLSALKTLSHDDWTDGSTAINLIRQLGASLGVSFVAVFLQWRMVIHQGADAHSIEWASLAFHETFAITGFAMGLGAWIALKAHKLT